MRGAMGNLETRVVERFDPGDARDGSFQIADLLSNPTEITDFDAESLYLLAWQVPSVTVTLTAISAGIVLGAATVEVGTDPTQVKIDWNAIDQLAISYTGALGFPVTDNFFFL
jgi:hypothetical protein